MGKQWAQHFLSKKTQQASFRKYVAQTNRHSNRCRHHKIMSASGLINLLHQSGQGINNLEVKYNLVVWFGVTYNCILIYYSIMLA